MPQKSYELGKKSYTQGKPRDPMSDHEFVQHIQLKGNEDHAPYSPGAVQNAAQRAMLQEKLKSWKEGWDDAHKEDLEE